MIRSIIIALALLLSGSLAMANNVRIMGDVQYDVDELGKGNVLQLKFTLNWDNSWRDDYNWDAVYICLKYRLKDATDGVWHHVYFNETGVGVSSDYDYSIANSYAKAVAGVGNTGLFVHRKYNGGGDAVVDVVIPWDITTNKSCPLTANHFTTSQVLISAIGIEMVYVPTGAFKLGDSESEKTFRTSYTPIPEEYDIVNDEYEIACVNDAESHPELAADRINDNEANTSSSWAPKNGNAMAWRIDFGEQQADKRTIRFFGVNASKASGSGKPSEWRLYGSDQKNIPDLSNYLWKGGPDDWVMADDSYPVEHAIKVEHPQAFRYYHIYIVGMQSGVPIVKTIGMTDQSMDKLLDHSVLVDGPSITIDSLKGIGARDGENWAKGSTAVTNGNYPNGFLGFYAMKYEISQEQYVKFLNKLSRSQQLSLLPNLSGLKKGNYLFGSSTRSSARNGIVITDDQAGKPYIFSDSLEIATGDELSINGETIACNFMSVNDMLAYADWVGLRPLSELEYEKISRRPFPTIPLPHEYAWNTTNITPPTGIDKPGTNNETAIGGNANYGGVPAIGGPLRAGAFAVGKANQEQAGVGFYGAMDLCGNLSEIYYNFNTLGRKFNAFTDYSHGDGYLNNSGTSDVAISYWPNGADAFALRGGSFKDSDKYLAVSDRSRNKGNFTNLATRDSTVSFRLGYSLKQARESGLDVYLSLQNGRNSKQANAADTICGYTTTYTIAGNMPDVQGSYTFIWYMLEDGGQWRILEEENDPNLTYSKFVNNLTRLKKYQFKRLMITPVYYAMTAPVTVVIDQVADAQINSLVDTIDGFGNSQGGFYVASTIASEFKWRWVYRGRAQTLAPYASGDKFSHYVPDIKQFKRQDGTYNYGENLVQMERTTKGVGSCFTTVDLTVYIKEPEDPAMLAYSDKVKCGQYMRDKRDNQVYPTTIIGNQCWMGKNLNWSGAGVCYASSSLYCERFGRMYTWQEANNRRPSDPKIKDRCPAGWHLPNNSEWISLINVLTDSGKKLKGSMYWTFYDLNRIGADGYHFRALPGGYYMDGWAGMNDKARWWTSDFQSWSYQRITGYRYWCSGSGSGCGWNYTHGTRYPIYTTYYNYDGYYVEINSSSNSAISPQYLRYNANRYNSDRLYVRCIKD